MDVVQTGLFIILNLNYVALFSYFTHKCEVISVDSRVVIEVIEMI